MPTLGYDCHIILTHPAVNGGLPYGFLLDVEESGTRPGGVQITRQVSTDGTTRVYILFDIVMADNAINPNGSARATDRNEDYQKLLQYLAQLSDIVLQTPVGVIANLYAVGFTADERHMPKSSLVKCQLNNAGIYWPPVSEAKFTASIWDGILTWASSYWR